MTEVSQKKFEMFEPPSPPTEIAYTEAEAAAISKILVSCRFKIVSPQITHKMTGCKVESHSEIEVVQAYKEIMKNQKPTQADADIFRVSISPSQNR